jgi:hypothetical protein
MGVREQRQVQEFSATLFRHHGPASWHAPFRLIESELPAETGQPRESLSAKGQPKKQRKNGNLNDKEDDTIRWRNALCAFRSIWFFHFTKDGKQHDH